MSTVAPEALHAILETAYANGFGSVPAFADWWLSITSDEEYDPALVFIAADETDQPIGLALCWTGGFIKDIAVSQPWRGKGIGESLLHAVFAAFKHRGLEHVDLKVMAANAPAICLYHRVGMVEVAL
ncbi:GNAT family N-acetyltransferase [Devosia sp. YR412]|uniref:GNAT family N-acetyltransferase n=1 Tax=Devosia sp. YR412 TaxID=1881030 RepID=UPI001FCD3085|nr:GNAT family N-acetyltransferase [Devosia sp. YR412]